MNDLEVFDGNDSTAAIYTVLYHVKTLREIIESYKGIPVYDDVINVFNTKVITQNFDAQTLLDRLINGTPRDISIKSLGLLMNIHMNASDSGLIFKESLYLTDVINNPILDKSLNVWLIRPPFLFVMSDQHPMNALYRCNLFNDLTIENYYNLLIKNQTLMESYNPLAVCKTINGVVHLYLFHDNSIHLLRNGEWIILAGKNMNIYVKGATFVLYIRNTPSNNEFIENLVIPFRNLILKSNEYMHYTHEFHITINPKNYSKPVEVKMPTLEKLTSIKLNSQLIIRQNDNIIYYRDIERFHKFLFNRWTINYQHNFSKLLSKCNSVLYYLRNLSIINQYKNNKKWTISNYLGEEFKVIHDIPVIPVDTPFQQERQIKIDFVIQLINILMSIKLYHKNKFTKYDPVIMMLNKINRNMLFIKQNIGYYASKDIKVLDSRLTSIINLIKTFSDYLNITRQLEYSISGNIENTMNKKLNTLIKYTSSKLQLSYEAKSKPDYQDLPKRRIEATDIAPFMQPMYEISNTRFLQNEEICKITNDQQLKIFRNNFSV